VQSYSKNYYWLKDGVTLTGIETINGKDTYAIKDGKTTLYYDVTSGLKLADSKTMDQGGKSITQVTNFIYREEGVKVPFNIIQNVGFELDIKIADVKSTKELQMLILNNQI
jgi:hypothetical protein